MSHGIYIAMGAARAQEHRLETLSNDLANAKTAGYKTQETIYKQIHNDVTVMGSSKQAMGLNHPVRFLPEDRLPVTMVERFTKFSQGTLRFTGNDLDMAVNGEGFFTVEGPNGPMYTRNGTFMIDRDARLVDQEGLPVLDVNGKSIQLSNERGKIGITQEGEIIVDGESLGKLNIVRFDDQQELLRMGNSNYRHPDPNFVPAQVETPDVRQQFLEMANVNPVHTMAMLIKTNRIFELNTKAMQAYKQMDDQASREVGKL